MTSVPVASIARSRTSMRPVGKATGSTRLELVASEVPAARPGGEASPLPEVEGEAGSPVTVVSLPARGRPPQAAARRAGLVFVEKVLTSAMVALLDGAVREHGFTGSRSSPRWSSRSRTSHLASMRTD